MADVSEKKSSYSTKVVGADPNTGNETYYIQIDASGKPTTKINDGSGNSITSTAQATHQGLDVNLALQSGFTSTLNSTTTPLAANATFTGTFESILNYGSLAIIVFSNASSAASGMVLQFSSDGVNVDVKEQYFYDASHGNGDIFIVPTKAQYFRIVYTNGSTAQTSFRLQTIYRANPTGPTNLIGAQILDTSPSLTARAVVAGQTTAGGGGYVNVKVNPSGALQTAIGDISGIVGQQAMAASVPVVIASNQSQVGVKDTINTSFVAGTINVSTTPVIAKVNASPLANRKYLLIQPLDGTVYKGSSSGITSTTNSAPVFKNQIEVRSFTDAVNNLYLVAASGTVKVYIEEGSGA